MKKLYKGLRMVLPVLFVSVLLTGCFSNGKTKEVTDLYDEIASKYQSGSTYSFKVTYGSYYQEYYVDANHNYKIINDSKSDDEDFTGYYIDGKNYVCPKNEDCIKTTDYNIKTLTDGLGENIITKVAKEIKKMKFDVKDEEKYYGFEVKDNSTTVLQSKVYKDKTQIDFAFVSSEEKYNFDGVFKLEDVEKITLP